MGPTTTATEIEQLLDLPLVALLQALDGMSAEDLQQPRNDAVIIYLLYRLSSDTDRRALFPALVEYFLAQARISER